MENTMTSADWLAKALQYEQTGNLGLAAKCLEKAVATEAKERACS